ncbi:YggT family protein [Alicyclobacillus fastidiosus]|uniref:YggT family protein n=1 Tax=Alicyclobacillus fastidiosus TaxID=392011 RepID=A0ABV5ACI8_9BACL|nr:YggT family protein [Alicyclobacillus fastidiosus]WEH10273.1 YggT family protein [Alicyclobacillus fastidiosus]
MTLAIYTILSYLFQIYSYMMIAWILMSWIPNLRYSQFGRFLGKLVDPYFSIFRRFIPPLGGIDLSPIVAFFVYRIIESIVFGRILPLILNA